MKSNNNVALASQTRSGRTYSPNEKDVKNKRADVATDNSSQTSRFVAQKSGDLPSNEQILPCRLEMKSVDDNASHDHLVKFNYDVLEVDAEDHTEIMDITDSPTTTSVHTVILDATVDETLLSPLTDDQLSRIQLNRNRAIAKLTEKRLWENSPGSVTKNFSVSSSPLQMNSLVELDSGSKILSTPTTKTTSQYDLKVTNGCMAAHPAHAHQLTKVQGERIEANRLLAMKKLHHH